MAFIVGAIVGGIAAVTGGVIAAHGATSAANAQAGAANNAATLQSQDAEKALAENQRQFNIAQANAAPFLKVGTAGAANLAYQMGILPPSSSTNGAVPATTQSMLRSGTAGQEGITATPAVLAAGGSPYASTPSANTPAGVSGNNFAGQSINGFDPIQGDNSSDMPVNAGPLDGGMQMFRPNGVSQGGTFDASGNQAPADSGGGTVDLNSLVNPSLGAPGSLLQDFSEQFQAPTDVTEQNDPGYKFRLQQGQDAIQRSAAARGGLLTGGTAKDLDTFSQGDASNEYSNVYNRAFNDYTTRYNVFKQNQADRYNKLAATSGAGQVQASTLANLGQQNAQTNANILLTSGQQIGQDLNNAGAARASGYAAGANAIGGAVGNIGNNLTSLYMLSQLNKLPVSTGAGVGQG